jgi:hypothetical protein
VGGRERGSLFPLPPPWGRCEFGQQNIKLTTYSSEYRIQNRECGKLNTENRIQKLMYIKLPMFLFFIWRLDLDLIFMRANPFQETLEGVDPENRDFVEP